MRDIVEKVNPMKTKYDSRYWLGIDGGGTKTDLQIVSSSGEVLASLKLGSSNPYQQSVKDICEMFESGRRRALELASIDSSQPAAGTIICLGGLNQEFRDGIACVPGFGETRLLNDPLAVLELCGRGGCCAILHAGTGSFIAARDSFGRHELWGGYGYLLREPGSAWDLGRLAVSRILDEQAGVEPATQFVESMLEANQFGDIETLIEFVYGNPSPVSVLAGYAPFVIRMLDEGDPVARSIVTQSFGEFGSFASRALSGFFEEEPAALRGISGKLFSSAEALRVMRDSLFEHGLGECWTRISAQPIEGIRLMLAKWAFGDLPEYELRKAVGDQSSQADGRLAVEIVS